MKKAFRLVGAALALSGLTLSALSLAQNQGYKVSTVLRGLENPWAMVWLPNGDMLITERPGRLRLVRDNKVVASIAGLPQVFASGQGGLLDIALHPKFEQNKFVYLTYSHGNNSANRTRVARGVLNGNALEKLEVLFEVSQSKSGGQHFGSRLLFLPDGTFLASFGDGGNPPASLEGGFIRLQAQNLQSRLGKIVRLRDDGTIPADNPYRNQKADLSLYSIGHRNIQGMAYDPVSKRIWATEHGAQGGDETNLVKAGENYGWPVATHSNEYFGPPVSSNKSLPGMLDPKWIWTPSIAPSGLAVYTGKQFPQWQGDLFAGGLRSADIKRLEVDNNGNITKQTDINIGSRVRDVRQGPDGNLYVLTDQTNGELLRISP
jgi:aldose sugar dehydrogenase